MSTFHLNGNTLKFCPHTYKLKPSCLRTINITTEKYFLVVDLNGSTLGFQSQSHKLQLKTDLHGTTLSHAICLRQVYDTELFRVNQTYNLLTIVVYDTKNVVGFWNMF